ncbi:zinc-dependent peptidase [Curvibacter sp. APW13]|uniref:M90 family metallopeptidase n=1 Tax=Curvibacter sp. APW13 TaxID=3077236 RepID=UPI0028DD8E0C|nr:zinc-dependent peptidase [Curvibacter sp. APW13]MDT8991298.1 zinc-dependent peptidase [Curvibacter sp. APW13]
MLLVVVGAALVAYWAWGPRWLAWRRARLGAQPFPAAWRQIVRQRVPLVARLAADVQQGLRQRMQVFIAEVPFIGCQGLTITEEMRVVVAAQACLLVLNRPQGFDRVREVLLYPGPFRVRRAGVDAAGVHSEESQVLSGESWEQGKVILSWPDCIEGAADPVDGVNVVIHEFAHQLDQVDGAANGAPPDALRQHQWSAVWSESYERIRRGFYDLADGQEPLFDDYALTAPAEFFACACELFFERGSALQWQHPALYAQLARYFGVQTADWAPISVS